MRASQVKGVAFAAGGHGSPDSSWGFGFGKRIEGTELHSRPDFADGSSGSRQGYAVQDFDGSVVGSTDLHRRSFAQHAERSGKKRNAFGREDAPGDGCGPFDPERTGGSHCSGQTPPAGHASRLYSGRVSADTAAGRLAG